MINLLDSPPDNHMLALLLLAQAGLPLMEDSCECGHCPISIEKFEIDVHRILITANGCEYELLVNPDQTVIEKIVASREDRSEKD